MAPKPPSGSSRPGAAGALLGHPSLHGGLDIAPFSGLAWDVLSERLVARA